MPTSSSPITWRKNASASRAATGASAPPAAASGPATRTRSAAVCGIRVGELLYPDHLRERLRTIVPRKNRLLRALSAERRRSSTPTRCATSTSAYAEQMRPHITDTTRLLHEALSAGQAHSLRGGPGQPARRGSRHLSLRDQLEQLDGRHLERLRRAAHGTSTASSASSRRTRRASAAGRFPTELNDGPDGIGERIRKTGREYGTVTGRPAPLRLVRRRGRALHRRACRRRRAGRHAARRAERPSGSLASARPTSWTASALDHFPSDAFLLERCQPVYETLPGWQTRPVARAPAWPTCRLPPAATSIGLAELLRTAGFASSRWARIGNRRSFVKPSRSSTEATSANSL